MSSWKLSAEFRLGDEVARTYNNEQGHIMEIIPGNPPRYKVTSPSDPEGYTYELLDHIVPSQSQPKPPAPQPAPITMPPPPDPSQQQAQPMQPVDPMQQQPMSAVESKKKKCHYCHRQANTFYVYNVGVCHEHDPPPSTPPADVTPTPTSKVGWQIVKSTGWVFGSGETFQDAAAEELQKYEALARDIMRTLPEDQWPKWVKNQAHQMVWGPPKQVEWPDSPSPMDTQPTQTTFPEDWNF